MPGFNDFQSKAISAHAEIVIKLKICAFTWLQGAQVWLPILPALVQELEAARPASPLSSPLKSGQTGVLAVNVVQTKKTELESHAPEIVEAEEDCLALAGSVQTD